MSWLRQVVKRKRFLCRRVFPRHRFTGIVTSCYRFQSITGGLRDRPCTKRVLHCSPLSRAMPGIDAPVCRNRRQLRASRLPHL